MFNLKGLNEKDRKRVNELIHKALKKEQSGGLNKAELKELRGLLNRASEKARKYEEALEVAQARTLLTQFEEDRKRIDFLKSGAEKKFNELAEEIKALENSSMVKQAKKEIEKDKEQEEFNKFYEEYCKKHGESM
ncbi:hypothetical protein DXT76_01095 [Halobacillus trueperi]|uniref:Uncharacterized protein n=1 Tax=Halobacillus trueperi TaxID=156205 RepID=A0A3D8VT67_9BACI|nr:hypothetical protein [Halobacillus trueperi]RDY72566.1 hypothetical protein DXT76_01095 [Halobacillus trueperi]